MDQQDRAKAVRRMLLSARQQGLLEPVFQYLEQRIGALSASISPESDNWLVRRSYADGGQHELEQLLMWLDGRSKPSPDAAQNTEDSA